MMDALGSRPVFLAAMTFLSAFYFLLKLRLSRPRARQGPPDPYPLVEALTRTGDPEALAAAIEEVSRTLDPRAVDALGGLLAHPDPRINAAAANVLGLIGDERALGYLFASVGRLEAEMGGLQPVPEGPAEDLVDLQEDAAAAAAELVWPDAAQGARMLDQHAKPGDPAVGLILALLSLAVDREADPDYRYFALKNLELTLPSSPVLSPAAHGPPPEQLARELSRLLSDPAASIRYAAVSVLEVLRVAEVADYLEGAIADPNQHVRARACMALAGVAPGRARKHLFSLLSDADPQVRRAAQRTLDELDRG